MAPFLAAEMCENGAFRRFSKASKWRLSSPQKSSQVAPFVSLKKNQNRVILRIRKAPKWRLVPFYKSIPMARFFASERCPNGTFHRLRKASKLSFLRFRRVPHWRLSLPQKSTQTWRLSSPGKSVKVLLPSLQKSAQMVPFGASQKCQCGPFSLHEGARKVPK
jgi:hypothetical protein